MTRELEASVSSDVHAVIADYAQALDAGRTADIVELFCPDGISEITGVGVFEGHESLREGYAQFVPTQPQLHLVANTVITSWSENKATATSNLAFIQRGDDGWSVVVAGQYDDILHKHGGSWLFHRRVTTYVM